MSEETFVRELERRAEDVRARHFGFEEVRTTAYRIRRRRRLVASGAAAAVVAAVLLVPGMIGGSQKRAEAPEPAPPSSPGHTAFLHDGQVSLPDGRTVALDLDNRDVNQLGVLSDGRIVAATSRPRGIQVFSAAGELVTRYPGPNQITMSADDTLAAWVDKNYRVVVLESGVTEPTTFEWGIPMPGEAVGSIDAVYGSDCANEGCTVLGGDYATTTTTLSSLSQPGIDLETSEPLQVSAVSPDGDRWAVSFPPPTEGDQFGCSGIYDVESDQVETTNCDTSGLRFAPDGEHLLGMRGDNAMYGQVEVYDQDLQEVMVYDPEGGRVVKAAAWEDESHLLVVTADLTARPEWYLLRVPIDGGDPETLVGPVDGPNPESASAFVLSD